VQGRWQAFCFNEFKGVGEHAVLVKPPAPAGKSVSPQEPSNLGVSRGRDIAMGDRILRVLLINDNLAGLKQLSDAMQHAGFEVITACDGWTGLEFVRQRHPDAVIWATPVSGSGAKDLQRLLADDPATEMIPVLFYVDGPGSADTRYEAPQPGSASGTAGQVTARIRAVLQYAAAGGTGAGRKSH
jgi:CheY-like chemotaxis protein